MLQYITPIFFFQGRNFQEISRKSKIFVVSFPFSHPACFQIDKGILPYVSKVMYLIYEMKGMDKTMRKQFLLCGGLGWCLEILWTGLHSLQRGEHTLSGTSSIWMFPIYGLAFVIGPVSHYLKNCPVILRGSLYTTGIFITEFTTGALLRRFHACPWDYSSCRCHYKGLIRLDYAPLWFCTGLFFEKVLTVNTPE